LYSSTYICWFTFINSHCKIRFTISGEESRV